MKGDQESTRKIIIAGYYGHRNAGDEAILSGILAELQALDLDLEFTVISGDPEDTARLHKVNAIGWKDFKGMIQEVKGASLVIVGGGGLIQDYWGVDKTSFLTQRQGGISEYGSPIILARLFGVPSMFYAVGVGPLNTAEGHDYTRKLFEAVDAATVRDQESRKLIEEIGIQVGDIPIVPDPAVFSPFVDLPSDFLAELATYPRPLIAVSLRYWGIGIEPKEWQPKIAETLDHMLEKMGGTVLFIPFHVSDYYLENDQVVCRQIQRSMQQKEHTEVVLCELDPLERFSALSQFDFVFGMRLHAIVAAIKAGLPCVGIEYDPKVRAFMDRMGFADYCFDLSHLNPVEISEKALTAYQNPAPFQGAAAKLAETTASVSQSARIAKNILEKPRISDHVSSLLIEFAVHQTLNVAQSEIEKVHLNELFRKVWGERLDPNFHFEHARTDLGWIESQLLLDQDRMRTLEAENLELLFRAETAETARDHLEKKSLDLERELSWERTQRQEAEGKFEKKEREWWEVKDQLARIEHSKGFRVLMFIWRVVWRIRDPKQTLIELRSGLSSFGSRLSGCLERFGSVIFHFVKGILPARLRHLNFVVSVHHLDLEDRSRVVLYAQDDALFPDYQPRKKIEDMDTHPLKVTLVTTVKNEEDNAQNWLKDLERQKRPPDEIVLLEGGSTDRTYEILEALVQGSSLPIHLVSKPGTNIATRRNIGVTLSSHTVIAMTDFGCSLKQDWLEKIVLPFMADPETEIVAGGYEAQAESRLGDSAKHELIPSTREMDPQTFLPACRSIAFRKAAWEKVGGFPEWLTKTGEDTYFDLQLKKKCPHWAFVPEAQVIWHAPETLRGIWEKLSSWTVGDGESGAFVRRYWDLVKATFWGASLSLLGLGVAVGSFWIHPILGGVLLGLWVLFHLISLWTGSGNGKGWVGGFWRSFGRVARVHGFLRGIGNRAAVMARRYADVSGVVLLLTGVPIDDTGGGARGTQIALELLRRGQLVVFVHKYPKQESIDLDLDFDQPNLLHFQLAKFDWAALKWELRHLLKEKPLTAILEFPFEEFLPIARDVERMGGTVLYDLIDEWNTSLGGEWYSERVERSIMDRSHVLVASAPPLVERLEAASGREVMWLPNAVNLRLFDRHQAYDRPEDLPTGSPTVLYIGALWGEWFDWELLRKIALTFPDGAVTVIGDYRGQCPFDEPNLHFLGLKPQTALPAYLGHSDVTIIPWKIGPITQATSPLKVFEYLAMGKPVVAPKLDPLEGIPYVFLSQDHESFIKNIERASSCEMDEHVLDAFLRENSWQARIDALGTEIVQFRGPGKAGEKGQ